MKTLLCSAILLLATLSAPAQQIVNNSTCTLKVTAVCYHTTTCAYIGCNTVTVPPGNSVAAPACPAGCVNANRRVGYKVCMDNAPCTPCTLVGDGSASSCAAFPPSATLPPCDVCTTTAITLSWVGGNLVAN